MQRTEHSFGKNGCPTLGRSKLTWGPPIKPRLRNAKTLITKIKSAKRRNASNPRQCFTCIRSTYSTFCCQVMFFAIDFLYVDSMFWAKAVCEWNFDYVYYLPKLAKYFKSTIRSSIEYCRHRGGIKIERHRGGQFALHQWCGSVVYITPRRRTLRLGSLQGLYERFPIKN